MSPKEDEEQRRRLAAIRDQLWAAADDLDVLLPLLRQRDQAGIRLHQSQLRRLAQHLALEVGADRIDLPLEKALRARAKKAMAATVFGVGAIVGSLATGVGEGVGAKVVDSVHDRNTVVLELCRDGGVVKPTPPPSTPSLSPRKREILEYVGQGLTNRQIADRLKISENTVKNHVREILESFSVHTRGEAAAIARGGTPGPFATAGEPAGSEPTLPSDIDRRLRDLTDKQVELLRSLGHAASVSEVAANLGVSRSNVYASLRRIARKLGATSVPDLLVAVRDGALAV